MRNIETCGLEEAEMYARFATQLLLESYEDLGNGTEAEPKIAGAQALIEMSRQIMRRILADEILARQKGGAA